MHINSDRKYQKNVSRYLLMLFVMIFIFKSSISFAGDYIPKGSYKQACENIEVKNNILSALCKKNNGEEIISVLTNYDACVGRVWNSDGALQCEKTSSTSFARNVLKLNESEKPLVVILINSSEQDAPKHESTAVDYFDSLLFSSTPSVDGMYRFNSNNNFRWKKAGIFGPYDALEGHCFSLNDSTHKEGRKKLRHEAVKQLLSDPNFNASQFDKNNNNWISEKELGIHIIYTCPPPKGTNPYSAEQRSVNITVGGITFGGKVTSSKPKVSFTAVMHELMHLLGAYDLYSQSEECECNKMALMASGQKKLPSLSAPHRFFLGWLNPEVINIRTVGYKTLNYSITNRNTALLFDPEKGKNEFFIVESRYKANFYDKNIRGEGLVVWRVVLRGNLKPYVRLLRPYELGGNTLGMTSRNTTQHTFLEKHGAFFPTWNNGVKAEVTLRTTANPTSTTNITLISGSSVYDSIKIIEPIQAYQRPYQFLAKARNRLRADLKNTDSNDLNANGPHANNDNEIEWKYKINNTVQQTIGKSKSGDVKTWIPICQQDDTIEIIATEINSPDKPFDTIKGVCNEVGNTDFINVVWNEIDAFPVPDLTASLTDKAVLIKGIGNKLIVGDDENDSGIRTLLTFQPNWPTEVKSISKARLVFMFGTFIGHPLADPSALKVTLYDYDGPVDPNDFLGGKFLRGLVSINTLPQTNLDDDAYDPGKRVGYVDVDITALVTEAFKNRTDLNNRIPLQLYINLRKNGRAEQVTIYNELRALVDGTADISTILRPILQIKYNEFPK